MEPLRPVPEALSSARRWVERVVVGLSLCPFARAPFEAGELRFALSRASSIEELLAEVLDELDLLDEPDGPATTLLVVPELLAAWDDFLDAVELAEELLSRIGREGDFQLAHFHPDYRFEGAPPDDPADWTNRSPVPMLHLLRVDDVAAAVDSHPDPEGIPGRNQRLLRSMGLPAVRRLAGVPDGS